MARHGGRHGASWRVMAVACVLEDEFLTFLVKFLEKPSKTAKITKNLVFTAISFKNGQNERKQNKNEENIRIAAQLACARCSQKKWPNTFSRHFGSRSRLKSQSAEAPTSGRSGQMASASAKQVSASQVVASAADIHPE